MKKNILKVAIIAAFGLFAGHTVYSLQKEEAALSEVLLDNVEALASESWTGRIYLAGENGTGGCLHCPERDSNCTC